MAVATDDSIFGKYKLVSSDENLDGFLKELGRWLFCLVNSSSFKKIVLLRRRFHDPQARQPLLAGDWNAQRREWQLRGEGADVGKDTWISLHAGRRVRGGSLRREALPLHHRPTGQQHLCADAEGRQDRGEVHSRVRRESAESGEFDFIVFKFYEKWFWLCVLIGSKGCQLKTCTFFFAFVWLF